MKLKISMLRSAWLLLKYVYNFLRQEIAQVCCFIYYLMPEVPHEESNEKQKDEHHVARATVDRG